MLIHEHIALLTAQLLRTHASDTAEITRLNRLINQLQRLADELEWAPMRETK
jgi:hypothetical protein